MAERLAVSEDRLMRLARDDVMTSLVQAKVRLAQTDYANLELQACTKSSPDLLQQVVKCFLADAAIQKDGAIVGHAGFGMGV
jgi:hypothetical protein